MLKKEPSDSEVLRALDNRVPVNKMKYVNHPNVIERVLELEEKQVGMEYNNNNKNKTPKVN